MASLGKLSNSLVSVSNENTLALLNVNIDFSVVRCTPSPQYLAIGSALTTRRKKEAESGVLHATACKLGFLFHEILPNTPRLLEAYGTRISEILSRPGINPEGTEDDGPFRAFVGADCTSIWAAATSGPASISLLLLACLLARAWDAKTATSLWFELIEERKRHIQTQIQENKIVHPHSMAAAKQVIGRSELAEWDASARSWLRRADQDMAFRHTQLGLITDNIHIPHSSTGTTYEKVTGAWIRSMEVLEKLLHNLPQQACDRAVLLAISSWHLYPDLLVFQDEAKKVPFRDQLFPSAGVLSVGLEYKHGSDNRTTWSLALSHLRYYGDPVPVRSSDSQHRIHATQLWLLALGAIFRQWRVSYTHFDEAVAWFDELGSVLHRSGEHRQRPQLSWLFQLCATASAARQPSRRDETERLIKYGWRRATKLLCGGDHRTMPNPFFGLCNPYLPPAFARRADIDCGIEYMRGIASSLGLQTHEAFVSYVEPAYSEMATIAPIEPGLGLCSDAGVVAAAATTQRQQIHWLHPNPDNASSTADWTQRLAAIQQAGELCHVDDEIATLPDNTRGATQRYVWFQPPRIFGRAGPVEFTRLPLLRNGKARKFQLWVLSSKHNALGVNHFPHAMHAAAAAGVPLHQGLHWLRHEAQPFMVARYLTESVHASHVPVRGSKPTRFGVKRKAPMDKFDSESPPPCATAATAATDHGREDATGCFHLMSSACKQSTQ